MTTILLHKLRWSTLKSLQSTPDLNRNSKHVSLHKGHGSVRPFCSLKTFSSIPRQINDEIVLNRQYPYTGNIHYIPSLRSVLSNSMDTSKTDILVYYFASVANILDVKEVDDYENMLCRK